MKRRYARHAQHTAKRPSTSKTPFYKRTYVKVTSFALCFLIAAAAFLVPSASMAPNVEAIEIKKATALSVGDLKDFSDVISENCRTEVPQEPALEAATEPVTEPESTEPEETEETTADEPETEETAETEEETTSSSIISYVSDSVSHSNALLSISNPDYSYCPGSISLSAEDRDLLERLVMGEAGSMGFTGCALIAQAVRDTMILEGISSVKDVISRYGYTAQTNITPNSAAVDAVSYIFDNNGIAVQHRILYFYAVSVCDSSWHESQNFVVQYGNVKFFD